jgi:hypothetical protein
VVLEVGLQAPYYCSGLSAKWHTSPSIVPALEDYVQVFDKKYRLFGVINLIDLAVVIAVLVAGFAVYRVLSPAPTETGTAVGKEAHYTVLCPALRGVSADQIKIGDALYKATGKPIGKVTAVRTTPLPGEVWDADSKSMQPYQSIILKDIWIDAVVTGTPTKTGLAVGDLLLHGGAPMPVMTSTFECDSASITTMTIVGQ